MMTQQLEVSILAAPLAAIDRRVLSQAWYSALRLAREEPALAICGRARGTAAAGAAPPSRNGAAAGSLQVAQTRVARAVYDNPGTIRDDVNPRRVCDARASRSPLARAIENAFSHPPAKLRRATFSMGRGSARIHVVLQTKGDRATLVAICRPELRSLVARALTQARLALAARGIGVELAPKGVARCS